MLDFFSKKQIRNSFYLGESIKITNFFNITYINNSGIAFGLLSNRDTLQSLLILLMTIIVIILLLVSMYDSNYKNLTINISFSLIMGGTLGNFYDRIYYKVVLDFIDLHIFHYHFPIFNIADLCIFFGSIFFLKKFFFHKKLFF